MSKAVKERRFKILSLDQSFLIDVFNWWRDPPGFLKIPVTDALPEDVVVVSIQSDWSRRTIELLIASEEWPPLDAHLEPERIPGSFTEIECLPFNELAKQGH